MYKKRLHNRAKIALVIGVFSVILGFNSTTAIIGIFFGALAYGLSKEPYDYDSRDSIAQAARISGIIGFVLSIIMIGIVCGACMLFSVD